MENVDIDNKIKQYEQKLSKIPDEYFTSGISEWNAIREKEIYFRRKIYYLNNIKEERQLANNYFRTPVVTKKQEVEENKKDIVNHKAEEVVLNNSLDCAINSYICY